MLGTEQPGKLRVEARGAHPINALVVQRVTRRAAALAPRIEIADQRRAPSAIDTGGFPKVRVPSSKDSADVSSATCIAPTNDKHTHAAVALITEALKQP